MVVDLSDGAAWGHDHLTMMAHPSRMAKRVPPPQLQFRRLPRERRYRRALSPRTARLLPLRRPDGPKQLPSRLFPHLSQFHRPPPRGSPQPAPRRLCQNSAAASAPAHRVENARRVSLFTFRQIPVPILSFLQNQPRNTGLYPEAYCSDFSASRFLHDTSKAGLCSRCARSPARGRFCLFSHARNAY